MHNNNNVKYSRNVIKLKTVVLIIYVSYDGIIFSQ